MEPFVKDLQLYQEAYRRSEIVVDGKTLQEQVRRTALQLRRDIGNAAPVVLPVLNGGMLYCYGLMMHWSFPLSLDTVRCTTYEGLEPGESVVRSGPTVSLKGRTVLLVDDLIDTGRTFKRLSAWALEQQPANVVWATAGYKLPDETLGPLCAELGVHVYSGRRLPDRWLFGFGMDYMGFGRDLPCIHALPEN